MLKTTPAPYTLLDFAAVETAERELRTSTGRRQPDHVIAARAGYPVEFIRPALEFVSRLRAMPTREARA